MNIRHLLLLTTLLLALAGCGIIGAAPTPTPVPPTPTPTPVPPTPTPRPTATPLPTPTPPPAAVSADVIQSGLLAATQADSYRVEFSFKAKAPTSEGAPVVSPDGTVELFSVKGEIAGKNSRTEVSGLFAVFLSGDPAKGVQFLTVDGKSYIRGPAPLLGAPEDAWYELTADQSSSVATFSPERIMAPLEQSGNFDATGFTSGGFETLDGQRCAVFIGDKGTTLLLLGGVEQGTLPPMFKEEEVDQAETRMFICEDGRLHKMTINVSGTPAGETEPTSLNMLLRFYDFNSNIRIEAPADARLPVPPLFGLPTPTP